MNAEDINSRMPRGEAKEIFDAIKTIGRRVICSSCVTFTVYWNSAANGSASFH